MSPPLMRIPAELRFMIYAYLFDAGETDIHGHDGYYPQSGGKPKTNRAKEKVISIRNGWKDIPSRLGPKAAVMRSRRAPSACKLLPQDGKRSRYHVMGGSFTRRYFETTYFLVNEGAYFCTDLMYVNRKIYAEMSHLVYADYIFDFGADVEAVKPFLSDLTVGTRALVKRISLYKRGPWLLHGSDRSEWRAMCTYLCDYASVEHLRLIIQAGLLPATRKDDWENSWSVANAPRQLSSQDVALLVGIRHSVLEWVEDLFPMKTLRDVEVLPDFCTMPLPETSEMVVYMALSRSVETGLRDFLRGRFGLSRLRLHMEELVQDLVYAKSTQIKGSTSNICYELVIDRYGSRENKSEKQKLKLLENCFNPERIVRTVTLFFITNNIVIDLIG
ncbi:hypothetical protein FHL15_005370 [Xylaria flabelliformis]|uniref:Uncharacterized protein n=1 Tax=Xylaria flabelliformis TaxID=2512241 RepID=A0A553I0G3_9PEZI|nr:hypothetical protein FHL15_005370 [Xylaria flabelliformis]